MTRPTSTQWTRRSAALRNLILLMLHRMGPLNDDTGRVSSRIREQLTLPDTKGIRDLISEVLRQMSDEQMIIRRMDDSATRTFGIELATALPVAAVQQLETTESADLAVFIGGNAGNSEPTIQQLTDQCKLAYRELQEAAKRARRTDAAGRVAINATGALKAIGLTSEPARRARYYLKELKLICSHNQCDGDGQLWWWTISDKPLDPAKLRNLATGDNSFEKAQERKRRRRNGTPEAGPVTTRRVSVASPEAPPASAGKASAPVAAKPTPPPGRGAAAPAAASTPGPTDGGNRLAELLRIVKELEERDKQKSAALAAKDAEIVELRRQLRESEETAAQADEVIRRFRATE